MCRFLAETKIIALKRFASGNMIQIWAESTAPSLQISLSKHNRPFQFYYKRIKYMNFDDVTIPLKFNQSLEVFAIDLFVHPLVRYIKPQ